MIYETLYYLVFGFSVFITSIVCHELGHALFWMIRDKDIDIYFHIGNNPKLQVGRKIDYIMLNEPERLFVYYMGIWAGLVVILSAGVFNVYFLVLLPFYIYASSKDLKNIYEILNRMRVEVKFEKEMTKLYNESGIESH